MSSPKNQEILSEDEIAFPASVRPLLLSPCCRRSCLSSLPSPPPRQPPCANLKDAKGGFFSTDAVSSSREKSLLERKKVRYRNGLPVTDITAAEWCEKKMEFVLSLGKPEATAAMKAGSSCHAALEKVVVKKVKIRTSAKEESWAVKFSSFILGAQQLLFEGLTRELPVIGVWGNTWIVGVIDELRMPLNEASLHPVLVDIKTRRSARVPSDAQKRNARLQLMCYKHLWDGLVAGNFPREQFFEYFGLNPLYKLSDDTKQFTSSLGLHAQTFDDMVTYFKDSCLSLSPSHHKLILRYELQPDFSLLQEYQFAYDDVWFRNQIEESLKFLCGEREASYVAKNETWKCKSCKFRTECPMGYEYRPEC